MAKNTYPLLLKSLLLLLLFTGPRFVVAQTTVFSDDFNTGNSATWTVPPATLGGWAFGTLGPDWGARKNSSRLELTNDATATANSNGYIFACQNTTSFTSPYTPQLNLNTGLVTWTFNMQQVRADPGGVAFNNAYANAFVLAATGTSPYFNLSTSGYAITYGQSGSVDPLRLIVFTNGMNNATTLITATISPFNDLDVHNLSVKVTYNPCNNLWEMFARNDAAFGSNPLVGTLTSLGTATNGTYVGTALNFMGAYWQGSTTAAQQAMFDNVVVSVGNGGTPGLWRGTVSTDWFNCSNWSDLRIPTSSTNVTIDQTAVNACVVGGTGAAVCNSLSVSSNNGTNNTLTVQNTASLTCSGSATVTKSAGSGNQKLTLLNSATFSCVNLTLTGSGVGQENAQLENEVSTSVTATVNGNMTINNGGKLDLTNAGNYGILHIHGDYINNGLETDFKQTDSYIIMDGTGTQTINTNSFTEIFSHLVVNKSVGTVFLLDDIEIEQQLDMQNGPLNLNTHFVQIDNNATTGIIRTSGYIISENTSNASQVLWQMGGTGGAHVFPFGTSGGAYIPFTFNVTAGSANDVMLSTYGTPPDNLPWPVTPTNVTNLQSFIGLTPDNRDATVDRFWQITVSGSPTVTLTFSYAAAELPIAPYNTPASMVAQRYDGGTNQWMAPLAGQSATAYSVTVPGVTTFSPWTLTNSSSPLPVELLWFRGTKAGTTVSLTWETASELNNDYFIVERATDTEPFTEIGRIDGYGTSSQHHAYSLTDQHPAGGNNYYRLKQTDFNGQYEYSAVVLINFEGTGTGSETGNAWTCEAGLCYNVSGWSGPVQIDIFDMTGRKIASRVVLADETGTIPVAIEAAYIVRFESEHAQEIRKVVR